MRERYRDLERKLDTLQEFVAANVGVTTTVTTTPHNDSSALQDDPLPASQDDSLPASQDDPLPASQDDSLPASQEDSLPASQDDSLPGSQDDSLPASQDEGFQPVRNGARPTRATKQLLAPITFNRFQVLGETMEDEFETRLVGDSMVRGQLVEFCGRSSNSRRKRFCYPGARLDDITAACDDVTSEADQNTLFIIHAGTNDVETTRSEELLEKYRRMINQYKLKTNGNNILISEILLSRVSTIRRSAPIKHVRRLARRRTSSSATYGTIFTTTPISTRSMMSI